MDLEHWVVELLVDIAEVKKLDKIIAAVRAQQQNFFFRARAPGSIR